MNCKLEKFWNVGIALSLNSCSNMNCKLEKFWNDNDIPPTDIEDPWTVNLKSFEMFWYLLP